VRAAHVAAAVLALAAASAPAGAQEIELKETSVVEKGLASWYGPRFHGRRTASGERFDQEALTAAHPKLPFGSIVRVKSLVNGRTVDVRINDRGPHIKQRILDLSRAAAEKLGLIDARSGTKPVEITVLRPAGAAASLRAAVPTAGVQDSVAPLSQRADELSFDR
jgi:rare lipoprotein A